MSDQEPVIPQLKADSAQPTERALPRPWCCPEPRCTPIHNLGERAAWIDRPFPGSSFLCFGVMAEPIEFSYDGVHHRNDLRSCSYTPLKGVIAHQENADDWRAMANAYTRALTALGGWATPSIKQDDDDLPALTDEQRRLFLTTATVPDGWRWCPDCNGEGVITVMDGTPDLDEHSYNCERCAAEQGIVPAEIEGPT